MDKKPSSLTLAQLGLYSFVLILFLKFNIYFKSMGKFVVRNSDIIRSADRVEIKKEAFTSFNESTLGLGEISTISSPTNTLAAIFDLANFTEFCKQMDPHLVVPSFLNSFLKWMYSKIREVSIVQELNDTFEIYCPLPFYCKFLGDGLLFLWDTNEMEQSEICNVVVSLKEICDKYESEFLPSIAEEFTDSPSKLRCGIARGIVYNIGDNNDFVGPCINMAARLQKVGSLSFCFSKRGIDYKVGMVDAYQKYFLVKKCEIRGIGKDELVCVLKNEFDNLSVDEKSKFKNPR